jgi:hypothetical protein
VSRYSSLKRLENTDGDFSFLRLGQFSDVTVVCSGHVFHLHKFNLITLSEFFRAALCHTFKEAESSVIELPEDDPAMIARVIIHLYLGMYPSMPLSDLKLQSSTFSAEEWELDGDRPVDASLFRRTPQKTRKLSYMRSAPATTLPAPPTDKENMGHAYAEQEFFRDANLAIDLYAIAVKLGVEKLQQQACIELRELLRIWASFRWQYVGNRQIVDASKYWGLVEKIYGTTSPDARGLRDLVLEATLRRVGDGDDISSNTDYIELLEAQPSFAVDMEKCIVSKDWRCTKYHAYPVGMLVKPCDCPVVGRVCDKAACRKKYKENTACWMCFEKGGLVKCYRRWDDVPVSGHQDASDAINPEPEAEAEWPAPAVPVTPAKRVKKRKAF